MKTPSQLPRALVPLIMSLAGCATTPPPPLATPPPATTTRGPAPARRALVVGVDTYEAKHWAGRAAAPVGRRVDAFTDLDGAVRDADAMVALLRGRFGFDRAHIVQLTDTAATRAAILAAIETHLVAPARPGDNLVFYYSGHGSEVAHPGAEGNKDETLVPADTAVGALDIRDKELARLWNRALAAGATLTVIMDSCHSGGTSRGTGRVKRVPPAEQPLEAITLASEPDDSPLALFLSASTKHQNAEETLAAPARGAFTLALERAIADHPDQTAASLFTRIHAELKSANYAQDPVLGGSRSRSLSLVGEVAQPTPAVFPFLAVDAADGALELAGGAALGLTEGSRLQLWVGGARDPALELVATRVELARTRAAVVSGDPARAQPGATFVVSSLAHPPHPLRVHVPLDGPSEAELTRLLGELDTLSRAAGVALVADPGAREPDVVVAFDRGAWTYTRHDGASVTLGGRLEAARVLALVAQDRPDAGAPPTQLFVAVPPPRPLAAALTQVLGADAACRLTSLADSDYALVGRPAQASATMSWYWTHSAFRLDPDWLLPTTTDARIDVAGALASQLDQLLDTLVRIHGWIQLRSGAGIVGTNFPFSLSFRDALRPDLPATALQGGHEYRAVLAPTAPNAFIGGQYLYLLNIDANGAGTLVFPHVGNGDTKLSCDPERSGGVCLLRFRGDVDPRFRVTYLTDPDAVLKMCTAAMKGCAFGRELFFLIVTDDPITDLRALEWDPVITRTAKGRGVCASLACLLQRTGTRSPVRSEPIPARWSIQRLDLESVE